MRILFIANTNLDDQSPGVLRTNATSKHLKKLFFVSNIELSDTLRLKTDSVTFKKNKQTCFNGFNKIFRNHR